MELPNDLIKATNYSKEKEREIHEFEYVNGKYIHRYVLGGEHEMTPQEIVDCLNAIATIDCDLSTAYAYIKGQDEKIAELKQKAIVPKFNVGDYFIEYWDTEPSIYRYKGNNHFECLNKVQGYHCDYIVLGALLLGENFIKKISKEEAEQKLAETKREKDD